MPYLEWLEQTVRDRIRSGAIGRPVFARLHLELTADHGLLLPYAAAGLDMVTQWLGSSVHRVYAQGGVRQGFISLLVEYGRGQTAFVDAAVNAAGEGEARLLLVGQHGTLRFDDLPEPEQIRTRPARGGHWIPEMERSLAEDRPRTIAKE
jgi:hypothetical protein